MPPPSFYQFFQPPPVGNLSFLLTPDSPVIRYLPSRGNDPAQGWSSGTTSTNLTSSNPEKQSVEAQTQAQSVYRMTTLTNASIEISFYGHGAYICGMPRYQTSYSIAVDQEPAASFFAQTSSSCPGSSDLYSNFSLKPKDHVITLQATSISPQSSLEFWSATVYSDVPMNGLDSPVYVPVTPQKSTFMNVSFSPSTSTALSASSSWHFNTAPFDNTLQTWTCTPGHSMLIEFRDHSAVQLTGTLTTNTTSYSVQFSGNGTFVDMALDAMNSQLAHNQTLFFANDLRQSATYQLNITNTGACLYFDNFYIWYSGTPKDFNKPAPFSGGMIAGIVIGSVIGLFVLIFIGLFCWWYKVRMEQERQMVSVQSWAERGFGKWNVSSRPTTSLQEPEAPVVDIGRVNRPSTQLSQTESSAVSMRPSVQTRHRRDDSTVSSNSSMSSIDARNSPSEKMASMGYSVGLPGNPRATRPAPARMVQREGPRYVDMRVEGFEAERVPLERFASMIARRVREPTVPEGAAWSPPAYSPRSSRAKRTRTS